MYTLRQFIVSNPSNNNSNRENRSANAITRSRPGRFGEVDSEADNTAVLPISKPPVRIPSVSRSEVQQYVDPSSRSAGMRRSTTRTGNNPSSSRASANGAPASANNSVQRQPATVNTEADNTGALHIANPPVRVPSDPESEVQQYHEMSSRNTGIRRITTRPGNNPSSSRVSACAAPALANNFAEQKPAAVDTEADNTGALHLAKPPARVPSDPQSEVLQDHELSSRNEGMRRSTTRTGNEPSLGRASATANPASVNNYVERKLATVDTEAENTGVLQMAKPPVRIPSDPQAEVLQYHELSISNAGMRRSTIRTDNKSSSNRTSNNAAPASNNNSAEQNPATTKPPPKHVLAKAQGEANASRSIISYRGSIQTERGAQVQRNLPPSEEETSTTDHAEEDGSAVLSFDAQVVAELAPTEEAIAARFRKEMEERLETEVEERLRREKERHLIAEAVELRSVNIDGSNEDETCFGVYRWQFLFGVCILALLLGVILGLTVGIGKGKDAQVIESPTAAPTIYITARFSELLKRIGPDVTDDVSIFEDPTTPQYAAMDWLANIDKYNLESDDSLPPTGMDQILIETNIDTYNLEGDDSLPPTGIDQILIERYVVALIYFSMNGKSWTKDFNFLTGVPVCEWHDANLIGVTCTKFYVEALDLPEAGLKGFIPSEIALLRSLQQITFDGNMIQSSIPMELYQMKYLTNLWLNGCSMTGTISGIGKLTSLESLDVKSNNFEGPILTEIGLLSRLTFVDLSQNYLFGSLPTEIGKLTSLTYLDLGENSLSGTIASEIGLLSRLVGVFFEGNNYNGTIPRELWKITDMAGLYLSGNALSGSILSEIGYLSKLQFLHLDENHLSGALPSQMGVLTRLQELFLQENDFNGTVPGELQGLQRLDIVYLDGNSFIGSIDEIFCGSRIPLTHLWADCGDDPPEVVCTCCTKCCTDGVECSAR